MSRVLLTTSAVIRTPCNSGAPGELGDPVGALCVSGGAPANRLLNAFPWVGDDDRSNVGAPSCCLALRPDRPDIPDIDEVLPSEPRSPLEVTFTPEPGAI